MGGRSDPDRSICKRVKRAITKQTKLCFIFCLFCFVLLLLFFNLAPATSLAAKRKARVCPNAGFVPPAPTPSAPPPSHTTKLVTASNVSQAIIHPTGMPPSTGGASEGVANRCSVQDQAPWQPGRFGDIFLLVACLRTDRVVETKPAFKLVKRTRQCLKLHGKFRIVIVLLVITSSTDTVVCKRTLNL